MENAFQILADYRRAARKAGVPAAEIESVLKDARSGDYDYLCDVIAMAESRL
jgi:hypothetical protein